MASGASRVLTPWRLCALCALVLLALAARAAPAAELPYGQGLLWRIERGDAPPSHVFGTLHSGDPRITRLPQAVTTALDASRALLVEVVWTSDTADQIGRASLLDKGADLEALLGPERFARVIETGRRYGFPAAGLHRFKPWVLTTLFSMPPAELARQ
ncbi:MAG: TraB/GumN family protein, partial [Geminicoccaceae bacterium]